MAPRKSRAISDEAVVRATGRRWSEWFTLLKEGNAGKLRHKEIARKLSEDFDIAGWWAQSITVEFERFIGRRETGQTSAGDYQVTLSRALTGSIDAAMRTWRRRVGGRVEFGGVAFAGRPAVSRTEKWRYWRVNLEDGTKVTVTIGAKPGSKVAFAINHDRLADKRAIARWKAHWKASWRTRTHSAPVQITGIAAPQAVSGR